MASKIKQSLTAAAVLGGGLVLVGSVTSQPASADAWGDNIDNNGVGWPPDGGAHGYCWGAGFDVGLRNPANHAMTNALEANTIANASFSSSCSTFTDIHWFDDDLAGAVGRTICQDWDAANFECDQFDIILDPAAINQGPNDALDRKQGACHEVGHSVGLAHATDDCMLTGEPDPAIGFHILFSDHHKNHIDTDAF